MKNLFYLVFFVTFSQFSYAQDNVYLLNNQLPMLLNPALSGSGCSARASIYYQQLNNDFTESLNFNAKGLNFDMPLVLKSGDKIGLGYKINQDAGSSGFSSLGNYLSVAYHKSLSQNPDKPQYLSIGLDAGIAKNSLDAGNLRWPSQITANGFDPTIDPMEDFGINVIYFDLNLGIAWTGHINDKIKSTVGVSLNHINKPSISFLGNDSATLNQRFVGHVSFDIAINERWSVLPSVYYTSQPNVDFYILATSLGYQLRNSTTIQLGGGYAKNNQPFLTTNLKHKRLNLGIAYGFENKAGLDKLEIVFGYTFGNYMCK